MTRNSILGYYPYTLFQTLPFEKPEGSITERMLAPQKWGKKLFYKKRTRRILRMDSSLERIAGIASMPTMRVVALRPCPYTPPALP